MKSRLLSGESIFSFSLKRVMQAIPSILAVITIGFILINLAPGDPVTFLLGEAGDAQLEARIRARLGLDAPLYIRYFTYMTGVIQGQLGKSYIFGRPVSELIVARAPATLILFLSQFIISTLLGITAGAFAAYKKGGVWDKFTIALSVWWYSVPVFWSAQLMLILLSLKLDLFPSYGMHSLEATSQDLISRALDLAWHLTLPALALALLNMALVTRITRSSMVESMREDYIITARAKGISNLRVVLRHGLRNAVLPVMTVLGLTLGRMMSGSVLVETVFSWPGLGRLMYDSILMRDYPVVLGLFLTISIMVIIANLLTDIMYAFLDPRVRYR
jgi:peptide/nickel transport system permease protein